MADAALVVLQAVAVHARLLVTDYYSGLTEDRAPVLAAVAQLDKLLNDEDGNPRVFDAETLAALTTPVMLLEEVGEPPADRRCPSCRAALSYDDGAYYCDQDGTSGEPRCNLALKRYPSP